MSYRAITAVLLLVLASISSPAPKAQTGNRPLFRANVEMVVVTFSVRDGKGRPVHGLQPNDLHVFEDGVLQKIASFAEGSRPAVHLSGHALESALSLIHI